MIHGVTSAEEWQMSKVNKTRVLLFIHLANYTVPMLMLLMEARVVLFPCIFVTSQLHIST